MGGSPGARASNIAAITASSYAALGLRASLGGAGVPRPLAAARGGRHSRRLAAGGGAVQIRLRNASGPPADLEIREVVVCPFS